MAGPIPKTKPSLTQAQLKELFHYDPDTGHFFRRAGFRLFGRYWYLTINGRRYLAHRLAWLYMTGSWPDEHIDHADRNPSNNRWTNLRQATSSQNGANHAVRIDNATGLKGVCFCPQACPTKPYMARIVVRQKRITLGYFKTPEEAHEKYVAAAKKYFGEFARAK